MTIKGKETPFIRTAAFLLLAFLTAAASGAARMIQDPASGQTELENCVKQCREEIAKDRADEAVSWGEKAVALAPTNAAAHFQLALAYDLKQQKSSGMGRLSPAKKYKGSLEKAVEFDPGHLQARTMLFNYLIQAPGIAGGSVEKAKVQAEEIAKIDPKAGHRVRAAVFQKEERWDQAETELRALAALDPKDVNSAASLANFLRNRKNPDGAENVWTAFLEADPRNADAHLSLGMLRVDAGKFDEAKKNFTDGLSLEGDSLRFHYQLGRLSAISGRDTQEGIEHLNIYLKTPPPPGNPTAADAYWRIGNIHEKTGNKEEAARAYKKALEINPVHKNAQDSLKALEKKFTAPQSC